MNKSLLILSSLVNRKDFSRKVYPFLKQEYFESKPEQTIFKIFIDYVNKYDKIPSVDVFKIEIDDIKTLSVTEYEHAKKIIKLIESNKFDYEDEYIFQTAEKWAKESALRNNLAQVVKIYNDFIESDDDSKLINSKIPALFEEALSVSFDNDIAHDYFKDAEERFDYYHNSYDTIKCDIDILNKIGKNGIPRKTENIIISPSGTGKSLIMCSLTASYLKQGYNVLYITFELSEKLIGARIDANLLDIPLNDVEQMKKEDFLDGIQRIQHDTVGRLYIQEYPPKAAHIGHIKQLLKDLKVKKDFIPDVICVDYLNICGAMSIGKNYNSFEYGKTVAEELRRLFVENNVVGWTAVQTNREGIKSSDIGMDHTSESVGIPFTADLYIAVSSNDELDERGEFLWKQIKNRYNTISENNTFITGVDKPKMRLFNATAYNVIDKQNNKVDNSYSSNNFHSSQNLFENYTPI